LDFGPSSSRRSGKSVASAFTSDAGALAERRVKIGRLRLPSVFVDSIQYACLQRGRIRSNNHADNFSLPAFTTNRGIYFRSKANPCRSPKCLRTRESITYQPQCLLVCYKLPPMFPMILLWLGTLARVLRSRRDLVVENLILRHQLVVLKRRHPRPKLGMVDKLFWLGVRRLWSGCKESLILVTPETVVRWHRAGFRFYWQLISRVRKPSGRKRLPQEVRDLILRMVAENPNVGSTPDTR